jgi:thiamine-phosphate pyrophosphorylase
VGGDGDAVKNIYRIIDANLNRAREGLRVVEEICRFVLEDKRLTLTVKKLRGDLSRIMIKEKAIKARRALADVGRKLYTEREGRRKNIKDIFQANIKRAEEAVRVLEEFSKLIDPKLGAKFKAVRFKLYGIDKRVLKALIAGS